MDQAALFTCTHLIVRKVCLLIFFLEFGLVLCIFTSVCVFAHLCLCMLTLSPCLYRKSKFTSLLLEIGKFHLENYWIIN